MQNIVVSTERDAKLAIGLLKQRDAGRATFLPVSTIRGSLLREQGLEEMCIRDRSLSAFAGGGADQDACGSCL